MLLLQSKDGEFDEDEDDEDDELSKDLNDDSLGGPISRVPGFYVKSDLRCSVKDDSENDFCSGWSPAAFSELPAHRRAHKERQTTIHTPQMLVLILN